LNQLSPERKQLLISAFFEGLSHAELAKKYKKPLGTIKSRLRLIYESLRKLEDLKVLRGTDD
jgi:RNA polymerase sigma-70 factor (ECF subfamily)